MNIVIYYHYEIPLMIVFAGTKYQSTFVVLKYFYFK